MNSEINILIADDHELIRKGLRQVLEMEQEFQVIEAEDGQTALDQIRKLKPHISILDIQMPYLTGIEIAKKIHQENINTSVIFLTMHNDEQLFNKAMDIGVKGFVLKENTVSEIVQCAKTVLDGRHYLSPVISEYLIKRNSRLINTATDKDGIHLLTPTENKVLRELATMKTNQELADIFSVSIKTIQNHRNNICSKLGISGTHALLKFALDNRDQLID